MSRIGELLSQHGLLTSVCESISSADLVNLAATSGENRTYITSSKPIYDKLTSNTICSGKGLEAQEKIFGPRKGLSVMVEDETDEYNNIIAEYFDNDPAEKRCLGSDSRPCSECGVTVCDNCRFHFEYPFEGVRGFDVTDHADLEQGYVDAMEDTGMHAGQCAIKKIECRKAFDMYWNKRYRYFCTTCEPPLLPETNDGDICQCTFYDHFVGKRWLCLPCFFEEEAAAQKVSNEKLVQYNPNSRNSVKDIACDCGALADETVEACRTCNLALGWCLRRTEVRRQKILSLLGYQPEREGILAQLG